MTTSDLDGQAGPAVRIGYLNQIGLLLVDEVTDHLTTRVPKSYVTYNPSHERASWVLIPAHDLVLPQWELRFADFVFNARAILDNLAWVAAHYGGVVLPEREEAGIYFPIVEDSSKWLATEKKPYFKSMNPVLVKRFHAAQPFMNDLPFPGVLSWLHDVNRHDKHRERLRLNPGVNVHRDLQVSVFLDGTDIEVQSPEWKLTGPNFGSDGKNGLATFSHDQPIRVETKPPILCLYSQNPFTRTQWEFSDLVWDIIFRVRRIHSLIYSGSTFEIDQVTSKLMAWRKTPDLHSDVEVAAELARVPPDENITI